MDVDRSMEQIAMACVVECRRQHVGLDRLAPLLVGYVYAADNADRSPTEDDVVQLAGIVEPTTGGRYRDTPVTFAAGPAGAEPTSIAGAVARMFAVLDASVDADDFARAFLVIHPFADGNGRVAFVLRNWLAGTLDDPSPLADYSFV